MGGKDDQKREKRLKSLGLRILRFNDLDVKKNLDSVLASIEKWIEKDMQP